MIYAKSIMPTKQRGKKRSLTGAETDSCLDCLLVLTKKLKVFALLALQSEVKYKVLSNKSLSNVTLHIYT